MFLIISTLWENFHYFAFSFIRASFLSLFLFLFTGQRFVQMKNNNARSELMRGKGLSILWNLLIVGKYLGFRNKFNFHSRGSAKVLRKLAIIVVLEVVVGEGHLSGIWRTRLLQILSIEWRVMSFSSLSDSCFRY